MTIFAIINHYGTARSKAASSKLVFDDEFNGPAGSAPNPAKWDVMGGVYPERWGVECFVNDRAHIYLDGSGHLVEKATYNPGGVPCENGSGNYESGGMDTGPASGGLFDFKYGTVVARIKVPCQSGNGLWPAFWSSGNDWPAGGEIDYLEVMKGYDGTNAKQTLHGPTSDGSWHIGTNNIANTQWCKRFHTYGAIWSPKKISFTIDGRVTRTITPSAMQSGWTWPFDTHNERLIVGLQVGGRGAAVTNSTFPQSMLVDYVRVYQGRGP